MSNAHRMSKIIYWKLFHKFVQIYFLFKFLKPLLDKSWIVGEAGVCSGEGIYRNFYWNVEKAKPYTSWRFHLQIHSIYRYTMHSISISWHTMHSISRYIVHSISRYTICSRSKLSLIIHLCCSKTVVLNPAGGTEPRKFHTCIHRTLRSWKIKCVSWI